MIRENRFQILTLFFLLLVGLSGAMAGTTENFFSTSFLSVHFQAQQFIGLLEDMKKMLNQK
jgi:hypothetical protein